MPHLTQGMTLIKKRMIHPSTYTLLQTTDPQLSYKYQNQLAVDYLIMLSISGFSINTNRYMTTHKKKNKKKKNSGYKQTLECTPLKSKSKQKYNLV